MVLTCQEARVGAHHVPHLAGFQAVHSSVVLTPQRGDGGRPDLRATIDGDGQVHSEERVASIGHRIHVALQSSGFPVAVPIQPFERQHPVLESEAEPVRHRVRIQARRVDDVAGRHPAVADAHHPAGSRAGDLTAERHAPAPVTNALRQRLYDRDRPCDRGVR